MASRLRLRGARNLTADGRLERCDVAELPWDSSVELDGRDLLVAPGLIDLHTHVFAGQDAGIDPDNYAEPQGVTTLVDTGSAGAGLFDAFRRSVIETARTRILAYLNISSVGTTSFRLAGELKTLEYCDIDAATACVERHRDVLVGIKVRASADVGGDHATAALRRARHVADAVGLPLMVHLGPAPSPIEETLRLLRGGDVLTHAFSGWEGNTLLEGGRVRSAVHEARARGVIFDIGHGMSGMSAQVTRTALDQGFAPDVISSDVHAHSLATVVGLPSVMTKLHALGMPLDDVVAAASLRPREQLGPAGARNGATHDVTVLRVVDQPIELPDPFGEPVRAERQLVPIATIREGRRAWTAPFIGEPPEIRNET